MKKNKDYCKHCKSGKPPYFIDERCLFRMSDGSRTDGRYGESSFPLHEGWYRMYRLHEGNDEGIVSAFIAYCWGASFKYLWRWHYKGKPYQDLEKAKWYINKMIEKLKEEDEVHSKNKT